MPKKVAFFIVEKLALCFQQHHVFQHNLEHPIAKAHGDMPDMANTKGYWDGLLSEKMAIIVKAQILLHGLNNGIINIRQINILVFHEAHHAKKDHPYARIIKNHYLREPDIMRRPRADRTPRFNVRRRRLGGLPTWTARHTGRRRDVTVTWERERTRLANMVQLFKGYLRHAGRDTPIITRAIYHCM